jgi:hypothetical protein
MNEGTRNYEFVVRKTFKSILWYTGTSHNIEHSQTLVCINAWNLTHWDVHILTTI